MWTRLPDDACKHRNAADFCVWMCWMRAHRAIRPLHGPSGSARSSRQAGRQRKHLKIELSGRYQLLARKPETNVTVERRIVLLDLAGPDLNLALELGGKTGVSVIRRRPRRVGAF